MSDVLQPLWYYSNSVC